MKHRIISAILFLFFLFILVQSCSKKGDPGEPGKDGAPGNAVNVSDSFQLTNADYVPGYWTVQTDAGTLGIASRVATRDVPKITQKILTSGTVLLYMKVPNGLTSTSTQYTLLPVSIRSFLVGYLTKINFAFETGKLRIYYLFEQTDAAGSAAPNVFTTTIPTYSFRYVIIPGSEGFRSLQPPVDYSDYEAVIKYYHLDG